MHKILLAALIAVEFVHAQPARPANADEWTRYGLTPGETRYSTLNQIDTSNVSRLGHAWTYEVGQRRRRPGSHAPVLERHALQHHQLEHRIRRRRAHRQGKMALGSGSQPG